MRILPVDHHIVLISMNCPVYVQLPRQEVYDDIVRRLKPWDVKIILHGHFELVEVVFEQPEDLLTFRLST